MNFSQSCDSRPFIVFSTIFTISAISRSFEVKTDPRDNSSGRNPSIPLQNRNHLYHDGKKIGCKICFPEVEKKN